MREGYSDAEKDLENVTKIVNETDLSNAEIKKMLEKQGDFDASPNQKNMISLQRIDLIFKGNKLDKIKKRY